MPLYIWFRYVALGIVVGVLIPSFVVVDFSRSWIVFVLVITISFVLYLFNLSLRNILFAALSISFIFIAIGAIRYSYYDIRQNTITYDEVITFEGEIVSRPETDYKKQKVVVLYEGEKVLISVPRYPKYKIGDVIKIEGEIVEPGLIEDFDYGKYLKKDRIFSVIFRPESVEKVGEVRSTKYYFLNVLYSISDSFEVALNKSLPEPHAALASGLILGIKRNIPDDLTDDLKITGLTHIIALSGYNVTIIISLLSIMLASSIGRKRAFWVGIILVFGFVIMSGAAASVMRAMIFSILILYSHLIGRRANQTNIVLLALVLMILYNPYSLVLDVGLQLSFMAFAGIIYLSPLMEKYFQVSKFKSFPEWIRSGLRETLSAQLMVLPLIIYYFGTLSLIAPISNLLVLWMIPLSMGLVFVSGLVSIIYLPVGKIVSLISWPALTYIIEITKALAKVPLASYQFSEMSLVVPIILYALIFYAMNKFAKKHNEKVVI